MFIQVAFFSATLPDTVTSFADPWLKHKPVTVKLGAMSHAQSFANSMRSHRIAGGGAESATISSDGVPGPSSAVSATLDGGHKSIDAAGGAEVASAKEDLDDSQDGTVEQPLVSEPSAVRTAVQSSLAVSRRVEQTVSVCAAHKKPRRALKWLTAVRSGSNSSSSSSSGSGSTSCSSSNSANVSSSNAANPGVVPVLVFCNTISAVGIVSKMLAKHYAYVSKSSGAKDTGLDDGVGLQGVYSSSGVRALHGNMPQKEREAALRAFVQGSSSSGGGGNVGSRRCHTLVATDVAARGLHMPKLRHVLNYDFPPSLEQVRRRAF